MRASILSLLLLFCFFLKTEKSFAQEKTKALKKVYGLLDEGKTKEASILIEQEIKKPPINRFDDARSYTKLILSLEEYYRTIRINKDQVQAINQAVELVRINKEFYNSTSMAVFFSIIADFNVDYGDKNLAEKYYLEAKEIFIQQNDKEHPDYLININNLANLYSYNGNLAKAEPLYLESLYICKNVLGVDHPDYSTYLNNLAFFYSKQGNAEKAEPLYLKAMSIQKKQLGEEHPDYATSLNNLAFLYFNQGKFANAEPLYLEALSIRKKMLGEEHPDYAVSLTNLAVFYNAQGNAKKAEPLYLEALAIRKKVLEEEHPDYATSLNNLAVFYNAQGNAKKAEPLYLEALSIRKKNLGEEHPDYAISLNNLADLYSNQGKMVKAEFLYLEALSIFKKVLGEEHPDYATFLDNLAVFYNAQGNAKKAEPLYLEALLIRKKVLGKEHPEYATSLNNIAMFYFERGNAKKAEPLCLEALSIRKKVLGEEHPDYAISLANLALFYNDQGNAKKTEPLYLEALSIFKKVLGEQHPNYATSLNNLAMFYDEQGYALKAEPLFLEALSIRKKILGEQHPDYATSLDNLAGFYNRQGKVAKAEPLLLIALSIRKKVLGEEHPDYANSLNNLAGFYAEQGNAEKAEPLYLEALSIRKKVLGETHPDYIVSLNNLAGFYNGQGKVAKAEPLLLIALSIRKKVLGEEHPDYANSLNNLAVHYFGQGNIQKAEPLYLEALSIRKKILGETHPDCALSLDNLAGFYNYLGRVEEAEPLFLEALSIRKKVLGEEHPDYFNSIESLAEFYYSKDDPTDAYKYYLLYPKYYKMEIHERLSFFSEEELNAYLKKALSGRDFFYSFIYEYPNRYDSLNIGAWQTESMLKCMILRNQQRVQETIENSRDTSLIALRDKYVDNKKQIGYWYSQPIDSRPANLKETEDQAEKQEKELTRKSEAFSKEIKLLNTSWSDVQQKLLKNEAAIEFVSFCYFNKNTWSDSILYGALVARPGYTSPKFIYLFEQKQLDELLKKQNTKDEVYFDSLMTYEEKGSELYDLIWKQLDSLLEGVNTVYISPSGSLNSINISAIPYNETSTLSDKHNIHILGSTVEIVDYKESFISKESIKDMYVYGGIDYDRVNTTIPVKNEAENLGFEVVANDASRGGNYTSWNYLLGTLKEGDGIKKICMSGGVPVEFVNGKIATETSVKELSGTKTPFILHLATHGYFFPDLIRELSKKTMMEETDKKTIFNQSENPLLRSGLIFAGANKAWTNPNYVSYSTDDGILTAYEISNLDLSSCELVVLSACETGLGDIKGSEGVFGLQRAFKMAGAKNIMMSLWKVPDKETNELMQLFYTNCFSGLSVSESLKKAQQTMAQKYPPYYWAAFKLLE